MKAYITPSVLRWAREKAERSYADVAEILCIDSGRIAVWEAPDCPKELLPELEQARVLAEYYVVPFGYFWLSEPPSEVERRERREVSDATMLDWIDADWPEIEADSSGAVVSRLEPTQSGNCMFRGKTVREALRKAILTPPFKGPAPLEFQAMSIEEQLAANVDGAPYERKKGT